MSASATLERAAREAVKLSMPGHLAPPGKRDIPDAGLRRGDLGAIVEVHGPNAFEVEFVETKLAMADMAYEVRLETGVPIQPLPMHHIL